MTQSKPTLGFLGCGNMGEAFLKSILEKKVFHDENIAIIENSSEKREHLRETYKVFVNKSWELFWEKADILFLAIKPQQFEELEHINFHGKIVISIMAGVSTQKIQQKFPKAKVIRTMPNLGQFTGEGMTGIYFPQDISLEEKSLIEKIFQSGGKTIEVQKEEDLNAVTAISGSGPAYFFYLTELLEKAAIAQGISPKNANTLARQTCIGAASVLKEYKEDPSSLWRERVTSKGGTTHAALESFRADNLETIVEKATTAAQTRAQELS